MPQFPSDHIYKGEPVDALYWRYSLRCRVEREEDKAYYWPQLHKINDTVMPHVAGWQDLRLISDQALRRMVGKPLLDGSFRTTSCNAPLGGLQSWDSDKLEKLGSRWLADNAHLIDAFENSGRLNPALFEPIGRERVHFFLTEFFGLRRRLKYDRALMFQAIPFDLWLRIGGYAHQVATSRAHLINQALDLAIWQGAATEANADRLATQIGTQNGAKHIWKTETGFQGASYVCPNDSNHKVRYWVGDQIEDAIDGCNRYGARWFDILAETSNAPILRND